MSDQRRFFVGGNWKMNGDKKSIDVIVDWLQKGPVDYNVEVVVAPPYCYLDYVRQILPGNIQVSAQNCYKEKEGAFTGEISPLMIKDLGVTWVITGHSERRHILGESDEFVAEKSKFALDNGLKVIYCVGEKLEERQQNKTMDVVSRQMKALSEKTKDWSNVVVAYEPVWAIGTGVTASPEQAQEVHEKIRTWMRENLSNDAANKTRIIYGGSVKGSNAKQISEKPDIDGFLVGGASLKTEFLEIVNCKMSDQRRFFVGGNWKMNGDKQSIDIILDWLKKGPVDSRVELVVAPPYCYLDYVRQNVPGNVQVSAQNCYKEKEGAFTGEISPLMIKDSGVTWVITGHSERRHILGESDEFVAEKSKFALDNGLKVIYCVGEKLEERQQNKTMDVVSRQMKALSEKTKDWSNVVVAYEPVWAIGTGVTASPEQAQEVHEKIRIWLRENLSNDAANKTRIIYGGSVKGSNAKQISEKPDIDGFLVGGASLKTEFLEIVNCRQ